MVIMSPWYYRAKIQELKAELQLLYEFRHPKYLAAIQKLDADYKEELEFEETSEKLENERILAEYEREQEAADKELEERLAELMDAMIQECEEHKKHIEHEFHNTDINSATFGTYPVNKKSLRRRPNEPTPFSEKRMRAKNPQQVIYALPESELLSDLKVLNGNGEDTEKLDDHHKTGYNLRGET
ncbi:unnamed protein product [Toxocara canis]|uniref:Sin3 histone deacetylase corepressor complex component sds3 n=1 Tax=Toxocara canis TaxID=6265 RepID=A0A183UW67_TOXCA|nr:unnamed protein product [Toxocara canis]